MKLNGGSRGFNGNRELIFESCLKKGFRCTDYKSIVSVLLPPGGGGFSLEKCIPLLVQHCRTFALTGTKYPTCPSTCVSWSMVVAPPPTPWSHTTKRIGALSANSSFGTKTKISKDALLRHATHLHRRSNCEMKIFCLLTGHAKRWLTAPHGIVRVLGGRHIDTTGLTGSLGKASPMYW